uniref:G_PROTEIN_RECEP_F1_2 domain-containing protein n=1 Tax=Steinernema glaseri TaxID=37863 RepID=A0A1I7ZEQ4_9BILA
MEQFSEDSEMCLLTGGTQMSEQWIMDRLMLGCNCSQVSLMNMDSLQLHCLPFPFVHHLLVQVIYIFMFAALITCAVGGNFAVIWIVLRHERMRTVTNYYLVNLAVADILISILNTGFSGSYNLYYVWVFGPFYCAINNLMGITPICASVFTMIVMSFDRYMAIVHPLRRRPGRSATVSIIVTIWLLAFLCGVPAFLASKLEMNYFFNGDKVVEVPLCLGDNFPDGNGINSKIFAWYNNGLVIIQYVIPLIILTFTYGKVVLVLRRNDTIGDTRNQESVKTKRKAANMLALVVTMFVVVWLPYNLYFLILHRYLAEFLGVKGGQYMFVNIYWLGMSSSVINPVIYYFMNERFRLGFRYAFRWIPFVRVSQRDYEITFSKHSRTSHAPSRLSLTVYIPQSHQAKQV